MNESFEEKQKGRCDRRENGVPTRALTDSRWDKSSVGRSALVLFLVNAKT